jgi:hypothetical protein
VLSFRIRSFGSSRNDREPLIEIQAAPSIQHGAT